MTLHTPTFPEWFPDEERDKYVEVLATHDWEEDTTVQHWVEVMIDVNGSIDRASARRSHQCRRCSISVSETRPNWRGMFSCDDVFEMIVATQVLET